MASGAPKARPVFWATLSARSVATITAVPPTSYSPYWKSGWNAMARFDGMVQGVVVQIRTETFAGAEVPALPVTPALLANSPLLSSAIGNST